MGVTGLWRLIEPVGKPVPLETLENKVLAVDISIWLHQMVKGYKDARGAPLPNAHLMGLFQRLCKLLYYRIKPVFVFDGSFPELKKETIARRQANKAKLQSKSEKLKKDIMLLIGKKVAIGSILDTNDIKDTISPKKVSKSESNSLNSSVDDMFKLPAMPQLDDHTSERSSESSSSDTDDTEVIDLHTLDVQSEAFRALPLREKHDLLTEAKETRKQSSWGRLHQLPKESDNFSTYQMDRLLKRRRVQECLEETEKEMGGHFMSLNDLENLLNAEGIDTGIENNACKRIASNENTRYLFIKSVKEAKEKAKKNDLRKTAEASSFEPPTDVRLSKQNLSDEDDELQKAIKMSLECIATEKEQPSTSEMLQCTSGAQVHTDSTLLPTKEENTSGVEENLNEELQKAIQMSLICNSEEEPSTSKPLAEFDFSDSEFLSQQLSEESNSSDVTCASRYINDYYPDCDFVKDALTSDSKQSIETKCPSKSHKSTENQSMEELSTQYEDVEGTLPLASFEPKQQLAHLSQDSSIASSKSKNQDLSVVIDLESESDSSDEAFEEVPDVVLEQEKPSVKVTLNFEKIGNEELKDDIFSDVFKITHLEEKDIKMSQTNTKDNLKLSSKELLKGPVKELTLHRFDVDEKTESSSNLSKTIQEHAACCEENLLSNVKSTTSSKNSEELSCNIVNTDFSINIPACVASSPTNKDTQQKGKDTITEEERENLVSMSKELDIEHEELLQEQYKIDRMGRNISEQMTKDAKELLQLFGIPYVEAPMEAEAQCAFLESANLTDGTITDDSDIWLFGGRTVYKNFFNQQKHILQFIAERIEKSFNLAREQMILLALLVGSDYTLGVSGVGPVTAMEILANFPYKKNSLSSSKSSPAEYGCLTDGLLDFKKWVKAGKRTSVSSLKNKLKNVQVTDDFPSTRVVQAYFEPEVEKSKEAFTWGLPEVTVLREFTRTKFGWSQSKLDEILKPVLKRMNERKHQQTIHSFFKRNIEFHTLEDKMSKRVRQAVEQMGPEEDSKVEPEEQNNVARKRVQKIMLNNEEDNVTEEDPIKEIKEKKRKVTRRKKVVQDKRLKNQQGMDELKVSDFVRIENVPSATQTDVTNVTPLLQRYQEIIPQREKDKQNLLNNKLKAIELFRKTKLDRTKARGRRAARAPKHSAHLSESSDSS